MDGRAGFHRKKVSKLSFRVSAQRAHSSSRFSPSLAAESWENGLLLDRDEKRIIPAVSNAGLIIDNDSSLTGAFRLNTFTGQVEVHRPLPSVIPGAIPESCDGPRILIDDDYTAIQAHIEREYSVHFNPTMTASAVASVARARSYHPIREYLDGLEWDGVPRLDTWLHDFLGAEDSEYTAGVGRLFLVGMVARVMKPGCKMDYTLILEGPQGLRKSSACRVLAGGRYFSDNLPPVRDASKDLSQHLSGKWLIEMAEMSATSRADTEALKAFLTRTEETYRPAYGRNEVVQPRQCVFIGTTNRSEYLRDSTGDRRFWPVRIGTDGQPIDIESLRDHRDQLFAEAYHLFQTGAAWWPDSDFEKTFIKPQQMERFEIDPWEEMILAHIENTQTDRLTVAGLLTNVIDKKAPARADRARVRAILQRMGYTEKKSNGGRYYIKAD